MAVDSGYFETDNDMNMSTDDVAALLVELYGEYREETSNGFGEEKKERSKMYAKAVGIAIRMLTD
jgi:hypothetical protein